MLFVLYMMENLYVTPATLVASTLVTGTAERTRCSEAVAGGLYDLAQPDNLSPSVN